MKTNLITSAFILAFVCAPVMAAKPRSFFSASDVSLSDGSTVEAKKVICTNKKEYTLLNISKKWCTDADLSYCSKSRMKAAKKACK